MLHYTVSLYRNAYAGLSRRMWLMAIAAFINRSGNMVLPFLGLYATEKLGFSIVRAGWLLSFYGIGAIAGAYLGGWLTDRIGFYRVQLWSLFINGLGLIGLMFLRDFWSLAVGIFLLSVVADAFRPANSAAIAAYSEPETRVRSYALYRLSINLGFAVGPAVGGIISTYSYNWLFIADGLTCIGAVAFLYLALQRHHAVVPVAKSEKKETLPPVLSAYRDVNYGWFIALVFLFATGFFQLISTIPLFYKEVYHLPKTTIGILMGANGLIIALVEMVLVYKLDGRVKKLKAVALGALMVGASLLLFNLFHGFSVLVISLILITMGEMLSMSFMSAYMMEQSKPANRGQYAALYTIAFSLAHISAPLLGTQLIHFSGYMLLWYVMAGICLLSFLGFNWLQRKTAGSSPE
jgi:predicted MFS family arabinose efflux permease